MNLLFFDPIAWDYTIETVYQRPLGGSQSALCYLAETLARRGHQVTLLSHTTRPGMCRGVQCMAASAATSQAIRSLSLDACVVLNGVLDPGRLREFVGDRPLVVLWTQHAADQPASQALTNPAVCRGYDGFVFVSDWQRSQYLAQLPIRPEATAVRRNAIAPAFLGMFPPHTAIRAGKARPPVLAYTSTPFRGLRVLIDVFPAIRRAVPGTRLKVFSSMQVYQVAAEIDSQQFGMLYRDCRETEGAEHCGSIPQSQLVDELRQVAALAYPNTFAETSCIAVMEAMAAGCRVITSHLGALPETTAGFGELLPLDGGIGPYVERFQGATIAYLEKYLDATAAEVEDRLREQVDFVNAHYTWTRRAEEWETLLAERIGRRR
jgi:glycosyltransferase involved in cell wall biosynthesis